MGASVTFTEGLSVEGKNGDADGNVFGKLVGAGVGSRAGDEL